VNILGNNVPHDDCKELMDVLASNENLTTLCGIKAGVAALDLGDKGLTAVDLVLVSNELKASPSITAVSLKGNSISQGELVIPTTRFRSLRYWSAIDVDMAGIVALSASLAHVTSLDLSGNMLSGHRGHSDHGVAVFGKALESNVVLECLDISRTGLSSGTAKYVNQALKRNTSITKVNLLGNKTGVALARALADTFAASANLHSICGFDLDQTSADIAGTMAGSDAVLLSACMKSTASSLTAMDISSAECSDSQRFDLRTACRKNGIELTTEAALVPNLPLLPAEAPNLPHLPPPALAVVQLPVPAVPEALQQPAAEQVDLAVPPVLPLDDDRQPAAQVPVLAKLVLSGSCATQAQCLGAFRLTLRESGGRQVYHNGEHYLFFSGARWLVGPKEAVDSGTYALMYVEDTARSPLGITGTWHELLADGEEWAATPNVTVLDAALVLREGESIDQPHLPP
jgi:hypothetical protein